MAVLTSSAGVRVTEGVGVLVRTDWRVGLGMRVRVWVAVKDRVGGTGVKVGRKVAV